jgi:fimbrial chaperone protein
MFRRCAIILAACACVCSANADPVSSSFEVAPTTIDLVPGKPGLFYIANRGDSDVSVQIQTMDWRQNGNADSLTPSETLYASPPLIQVAPGERQVVRLLADPADTTRETQYRLIVSQLPQGETSGTAVRVLLQFSIPVFAGGDVSATPDIVWSAARDGKDLQISARNNGTNALKLIGVSASAGAAQSPVTNTLAYVLPGATRSWRVALGGSSRSLHLIARDERSGAALDSDIALER